MSTETSAVETVESVQAQTEQLKARVRAEAERAVRNGELSKPVANAALTALGVEPLRSYRFYEVAVPVEQVVVMPYKTRGESEATVAEKLRAKIEANLGRLGRGRDLSQGRTEYRIREGFDVAAAVTQTGSEDGSDVVAPELTSLEGTFTDELLKAKAELELLDANVRRVLIWLCRSHGLCGSGVQRAADRIGLVGFNAYPKSVPVQVPASGFVTTVVQVFDGEDAAVVAGQVVAEQNELGRRLTAGRFTPENIQTDQATVVEQSA